MDIFDQARELGQRLRDSKEYTALTEAEETLYNDLIASSLLSQLEARNIEYKNLISRGDKDIHGEKIIVEEIKKIKKEIDDNQVIKNLNLCQHEYDNLVRNVNNLIDYITGKTNNKSKCSSCNGCHSK